MKLTSRQLNTLNNILQQESADRKNATRDMYDSRKSSLLIEREIYDEMPPEDLSTALQSELEQDVLDMGSKVRVDFDKVLFKKLTKLVEQAGGEKISASTLQDDLEDFDADGMIELQQEFAVDLVTLLEKYAAQIALLTSHAKLSGM